jgi:hypothetical protein
MLLLLSDPLKNENKYFLDFYFLCGFLTQSLNIISKASTLCSTKVLSQEGSKFVDLFCKVLKKLFSSLQML